MIRPMTKAVVGCAILIAASVGTQSLATDLSGRVQSKDTDINLTPVPPYGADGGPIATRATVKWLPKAIALTTLPSTVEIASKRKQEPVSYWRGACDMAAIYTNGRRLVVTAVHEGGESDYFICNGDSPTMEVTIQVVP